MQYKICSKCQAMRPISEFYKQKGGVSGVRGDCKMCFNEDAKIYAKKNRASRNVIVNNWRLKNRLRLSEQYKESSKKYRSKNPNKKAKKDKQKQWAVNQLNQSVIRGETVKPYDCTCCGSERPLHGHHTDYLKPLDVIWLCSSCHGFIHSYTTNFCELQRGKE